MIFFDFHKGPHYQTNHRPAGGWPEPAAGRPAPGPVGTLILGFFASTKTKPLICSFRMILTDFFKIDGKILGINELPDFSKRIFYIDVGHFIKNIQ